MDNRNSDGRIALCHHHAKTCQPQGASRDFAALRFDSPHELTANSILLTSPAVLFLLAEVLRSN